MMPNRRTFVLLATVLSLGALAACSLTNGDAIPSQVYDASALDVGANGDDLDGGTSADGGTTKDGSRDAPSDSPADAVPPGPDVKISELFVDNDGLGDGAELVELRGAPGTAADDLTLRVLYANGQVKYELSVAPAGSVFAANGLWVVGGGTTFKLNVQDHVDRIYSVSTWGLDNSRGAVQLVRGTTLLDVVGYATDADAGALAPPASSPTATGEGAFALVPPAGAGTKGISFGRRAADSDTDDNRADFCPMEASPGYAQKPCQ